MLWTLAGLVLFAFAFYGIFMIILNVTETRWLADPPFHEATDFRSTEPHEIALIDSGADSLALRLKMIREAQGSIDLEFFIYELDTTSRLITQAITERARAGVRVRVLVDFSLAVFKLRPAYARAMRAAGVEVRYYNTASIVRFFTMQHRTHRKMLVTDADTAMIGGRNIADDYFDLSHHYNFLDSDALIAGPAVAAIRESFDLYWHSSWAKEPDDRDDQSAPDTDLTVPNDKDRETLALLSGLSTREVRSTCQDVRFVTDYPGSGVSYRRVFSVITELMAGAKEEVLAESPYFVLRPGGQEVIRKLTAGGVRLRVLTNSLHSTDAYYTVAPLFINLKRIALPNFDLFAYLGQPLRGYDRIPARSVRWGVHAKRAVVDHDTIMIGTYNIDPRSANLNSELMLVCAGNTELADAMRASIEARMQQWNQILNGEAEPDLAALVAGADSSNIIMMLLAIPLSSMFDFLL
jgi:putative cardiolipin synthase